ncbi:MAG: hypothetical protein GKR77_02390 [Legionellales bacterium]|nr:hypothetical protein [Legionellales bacterium]
MPKSTIEKNYVSKVDQFINDLNQQNPASESQQREIAKHQRIAQLRDQVTSDETQSTLWEDF